MNYINKNNFKEIFKANPIVIIFVYLAIFLFGTITVTLIVSDVAANMYSLTFKEAFSIGYSSTVSSGDEEVYYFIQSYTNLFAYMLLFIGVGIFSFDYLKEDIKIFKNYKNIIKMIICAVVFLVVALLVSWFGDFLIEKISGSDVTSANEESIESMIDYGYYVPIFLATVVFAPLTEELVYRKAIFKLSETKMRPIFQMLISGIIFAIPHMISSTSYSVVVWIILFFIYFISGFLLALIYHVNKNNVYASLSAHLLNNLYSVIAYI